MSNDEHACILKLCQQNLETNVRKCIVDTFNNYIEAYHEQLSDLDKEVRVKKVMKKFQQKLKHLALDENCQDLHDDFFAALCKEVDYLDTLLIQVTKLKLQLLSKVRTAKVNDVDLKIPDKSEFAKEILKKNAYTFFHLVPMYYQYFQTRNILNVRPIVDSVTEEVMDSLTTRTYSLFFSRPPEAHVIYQDKMEESMKHSGCTSPRRSMPKEIEDEFENERKNDKEKTNASPAPEYKEFYIEEDGEVSEKASEKNSEKDSSKNDDIESVKSAVSKSSSFKLDNLLYQMKKEAKAEEKNKNKMNHKETIVEESKSDMMSTASDDLDDALPRDTKRN